MNNTLDYEIQESLKSIIGLHVTVPKSDNNNTTSQALIKYNRMVQFAKKKKWLVNVTFKTGSRSRGIFTISASNFIKNTGIRDSTQQILQPQLLACSFELVGGNSRVPVCV